MSGISALTNVSSDYIKATAEQNKTTETGNGFGSIMDAAMNMVSESNATIKDYEAAQIQFALGEADNTHDLQIAQEKANISLQYTAAVRDRLLTAYNEIMNMQI